jgi:hypothetical protein
MRTIFIYIGAWLGLVILAIINGTLREKGYGPLMSELRAHQISTIVGIVFFGTYTWLLSGPVRIETGKQAIAIGSIWLFMTIGFEFGFGHFMMGHSWERLFHDYNILSGRIWILVLLWTAVLPYICFKIRVG